MFRRWWFVKLLRGAEPQPGRPRGRLSREQQELVLREWEVLRDRLAAYAGERVTTAGELFRAAELQLPPEEDGPRRDYLWALEAYEASGRLLDEAADLPDLAAAVVLAERAVERLAAAHAAHAGARPHPPALRCFYNPLHPPVPAAPAPRTGKKARQRPHHSAREAAADRRPACHDCRKAILAGQQPDILPALLPAGATGRRSPRVLVPYFAVPQQWSPWSATACGAYDDTAPALVLRGEHRRRTTAPSP
ncbi:hypothetical protein CFP65_0230 [Kitasatospora sp. MMS16-BH015]|uniref:hypothetical protein n=1 Tax=Kitasatospora sp. MMS16-BH015 TaxID=2018025 RepID=UPI000CA18EDE|nr:hypothetical protein [Kitasatospora sp. MMS16-BH015]AUG75209.1 hypothetical protein CFP65_0230 [Kitasatospora sp. MMS16-BH015]